MADLTLTQRAQIDDLLATYVLALDVDDTEAMVALFAEDGEFRVYGRVFAGHDGLRRMLEKAPKGLHLAGRSLITATGTGATVRQQLVFFPASGEKQRLAIYDDEIVPAGDRWLFQSRTCRFMNSAGVLGPRP